MKPGYEASASSTAALEKARPTGSGEASRTVHRSRVEAPSSVSASGVGSAPMVQVVLLPSSRDVSWSRTQSAFSSMSSPVSTNSTELRYPPSSLMHTFSFSGGAEPRTPEIRTRSAPSGVSRIEVRSVVTSGPRYCGPCTSYISCAVTVSIETTPPVSSCLVITDDPSAAISASGKAERHPEA